MMAIRPLRTEIEVKLKHKVLMLSSHTLSPITVPNYMLRKLYVCKITTLTYIHTHMTVQVIIAPMTPPAPATPGAPKTDHGQQDRWIFSNTVIGLCV